MERLKFAAIASALFIICYMAFASAWRGEFSLIGASMYFVLGYPFAWMLYSRIKEEHKTNHQHK